MSADKTPRKDTVDPSELDEHRGETLPDREVMSLVTPATSSLWPGYGAAAAEATDAAGAADETTALTGTDADASASEDATVTDEDRSHVISRTDTAVSET